MLIIFTVLFSIAGIEFVKLSRLPKLSPYPFGFNFAFTITDDPDGATLEKIKPVYNYLRKNGIKITTAVWVFKGTRSNGIPDIPKNNWSVDTCERYDYLAYIQQLQKEGFEIALHGVSPGNDIRDKTINGYEQFRYYFGDYPKINIMHAENLENVYWGKKVVSNRLLRLFSEIFINKSKIPFSGEQPISIYFWGDILQQKTKYVRLFGSSNINTLEFNPSMPYHDSEKPYVNYWFSFSDGFGIKEFNSLISKENVDKLVNNRGACIVYTHFAHGFVNDKKLNETFQRRMNYLVSQTNGWFVPATDILDRLLLMKKVILIKEKDRFMLVNLNEVKVKGITVILPSFSIWYDINGREYETNDEREIIIKNLDAGSAIVLFKKNPSMLYKERTTMSADNKAVVINFEDAIYIVKNNVENTDGLFSEISSGIKLFDKNGREIDMAKNVSILADEREQIFFKNKNIIKEKNKYPGGWEEFNMIFQRALLFIKHNIGK